jgi:uncharacterized protein (DUF433 family)
MTEWRKYLVARRDVAGGQLCARGTRIPVTVILDSLAEGASISEIIRSYRSLKPAHVRAAIAYAAALAREEQLTPLAGGVNQARRESAGRAS